MPGKFKKQKDCPFIMIPKSLLKSSISCPAKIVYFIMLERYSLSEKNGWVTDEGGTYIILTCKDIMNFISCSKSSAIKALAELEKEGFIKRKHQGRGLPDLIFLTDKAPHRRFNIVAQNKDPKENEFNTSEGMENKPLEDENSDPNNNNINNNKINKNNINYSFISFSHITAEERKEYKEKIKINVSYDALITDRPKEKVDEIIDAMVDALSISKEYVEIGNIIVPSEELKERVLSMNQSHIEYICDGLTNNTTDIKNMSAYLLACIYRATAHINLHYMSMVNHDMKHNN